MGCEIECFPQELGDTILKHQLINEEFLPIKKSTFCQFQTVAKESIIHQQLTHVQIVFRFRIFLPLAILQMFVGCEKLMIPSVFLCYFCSVNIDIKSLSQWCDIA